MFFCNWPAFINYSLLDAQEFEEHLLLSSFLAEQEFAEHLWASSAFVEEHLFEAHLPLHLPLTIEQDAIKVSEATPRTKDLINCFFIFLRFLN
jgi:hypothetical protein